MSSPKALLRSPLHCFERLRPEHTRGGGALLETLSVRTFQEGLGSAWFKVRDGIKNERNDQRWYVHIRYPSSGSFDTDSFESHLRAAALEAQVPPSPLCPSDPAALFHTISSPAAAKTSSSRYLCPSKDAGSSRAALRGTRGQIMVRGFGGRNFTEDPMISAPPSNARRAASSSPKLTKPCL